MQGVSHLVLSLLLSFAVGMSGVSEANLQNAELQDTEFQDTEFENLQSQYTEFQDDLVQELDGGIPAFTDEEKQSTKSFESYSELDELGRCGVAFANIGPELLPKEERGVIGMVKPSGWHTVKYEDLIEDKYLYNRCHLIAYELTGQNGNERNLITGTRYLNIQGMLPYENQVYRYIKETGNHVLYRATPIFERENLLANGVELEAWSVEDFGFGICIHVFCKNIQPGIAIDYATGDSKAVAAGLAQANESPGESAEEVWNPEETDADYILNTNSKKFHFPRCDSVKDMAKHNRLEYSGERDDLIAQGYVPCKRCNP